MPDIKPVGASSKINMLLHADIGTGKTSFIGTGGSDYKILIMRPPIDHTDPIIGSGVQEMIVKNWEEIFDGLEYVRHEGAAWDWFWIDSISLLQDIGLDDVYEGVLDKKGPVGSQARKEREQFGPDRGEYRVNMWRLAQWVRHCVGDGSVNLGITAHSFWWEPNNVLDELTPSCLWPWIQGKNMPSKICGMMNIVGYMEVETRERGNRKRQVRVLHTNKTERYYAKCQFKLRDGSSVFGDGDIVNPTLPGITEAIMASRPSVNGAGPRRRRREQSGVNQVRR
jgi:hypothetical protein